jgi:hypothetical protein
MDQLTRRSFLTAGGALGAALLAARAEDVQAALASARAAAGDDAPRFEVLTPEEAADIEAFSAQIIPTDDLPGAREARVVVFADRSLATWAADQLGPLRQGLALLTTRAGERRGGARFAQLTAEQQLEVMRALENTPVFGQLRFLTLVGTFAHPAHGANHDKAGWRIIGYDDRGFWQPPFGWYDARANGGPN